MSEKIVLKDRSTKKIKLPESGVTVEIYASLLVRDIEGINFQDVGQSVSNGIKVLSRLIKSWNLFASETDETPRDVNEESISLLPAADLNLLFEEVEMFTQTEKKN